MSTNQPQPSSLASSAVLSAPSDPDSSSNTNNAQTSPSNSSSAPLILYTPPTFISLVRSAAINLFLPFVNGLMLGFGELFAHEIAFRLGWSGTNVFPLSRRSHSHAAAPGIEIVENSFEKRRRSGGDLQDLTSLE
ncbi:hypothetical protein H072_7261 [Dactylellina haptotyla CBS 200.50]|uniref:Outer membrane protein Tom13 n=1 Tax=Dactylellina haptotyla (strain CBS 200.50) TaxID=1284197 RepID=S8A813_DACHA|nr:hypothetical protein H072_7261 [Dactylellina haptotyla CBS 200.50]